MLCTTIVLFLTILKTLDSARILGVYPLPSRSDFKLNDRLLRELALRGHDVTVIVPFEDKQPMENFRQIVLANAATGYTEHHRIFFEVSNYNILEKTIWLDSFGIHFTETTLNDTNVKQFLEEKNSFDLVIVQYLKSDAFNGFCYHFGAPCVVVNSITTPSFFRDKVGSIASPAYVPELFLALTSEMNIWQRSYNALVHVLTQVLLHLHFYPNQNRLLQKYFRGAPHLDDLIYNVSLILLNGHTSVSETVQYTPNTINIAGFHVSTSKKLPEDLQRYLDQAVDGAILFSMGSNLPSKYLDVAKRDIFLKTFSKLKQKVLWKWDEDRLPNKSENVLTRHWLPQEEVLAHPNVVLFVTHCGLLSIIESVYHAKPVLGIPVFGDQVANAALAQARSYGRYIPFQDLSEENFHETIHEMLSNSRYATNVKRHSKIMHDRPQSAMENAMYWVEYVLRHKGAPHLRSPGVALKWYQYYLLDAIAFCVTLGVIFIFFTIQIFSFIYQNKNSQY